MTTIRPARVAALTGRGVVSLAAVGAAAAGALALTRGWWANWGATDAEAASVLPGDELVPAPRASSTRAVTVGAPPAAVWPWLVQMGQGRGGLYSYSDAPWSRISNGLLTPPVEFFMERKMLLGIKARAERPTGMTGSIEATGPPGPSGPGVG